MHDAYTIAIYKGGATARQALAFLAANRIKGTILVAFEEGAAQPGILAANASVTEIAAHYKRWLLPDEAALVVPARLSALPTIHKALREQSQPYLLLTGPGSLRLTERPLLALTPKNLIASRKRPLTGSAAILTSRLNEAETVIDRTRSYLLAGEHGESSDSLAQWGVAENESSNKTPSEWILDNWQTIKIDAALIRRAILSGPYRALPSLQDGRRRIPRVYAVASELVTRNQGCVSRQTLDDFLGRYQQATPLHEIELELLPVFIKLALLEYIANLCREVRTARSQSEMASFWVARLVAAVPGQSAERFMASIRQNETPSPAVIDTIAERMQDEELVLPEVGEWLTEVSQHRLIEVIQEWHGKQSSEQIAFSNSSQSFRFLSHARWEDIQADLSPLEKELAHDPAQVYSRMEPSSKRYYRTELTKIARGSSLDELAVARKAIGLAAAEPDEVRHHVGYFIIDAGRPQLETAINSRLSAREKAIRFIRDRHSSVFFTSIAVTGLLLAALLTAAVAFFSHPSWIGLAVTFACSLVIGLDIGVQLIQYLLLAVLPPSLLPKFDFKKGIPERYATTVVVPTLLLTAESVRSECERLEIRYLANPDPGLTFGLLTDFSDAPNKTMLEDAELLEVARSGIKELNRKHSVNRFYLFHRQRVWCESENVWMGWERKRGKLEQFNAWLLGQSTPGIILQGDEAAIRRSVFVITLDADTQLALGTAHRLVAALAHPLNRVRLSPNQRSVERGYTVIAPRVSTSLPSATATFFSRIYSNASGVDPYSTVVSDFYQDLSGESSYQGKGIYDVAAFHAILKDRIPESYILSHDLLEGSYVRVGLASDIELYDLFPSDYISYSTREHRWIRGDWQIIGWLKRISPKATGPLEANPFSLFAKWKIADNLRRSLVPLAAIVALLFGWFSLHSPLLEVVVVACYFISPLLQAVVSAATRRFSELTTQDFGHQLLRSVVRLAFMPHAAYLALDAIVRVFYRKWISHRLLLEWQTAAEAQRRSKDRQRDFIIGISWIPISVIAIAALSAANGTFFL